LIIGALLYQQIPSVKSNEKKAGFHDDTVTVRFCQDQVNEIVPVLLRVTKSSVAFTPISTLIVFETTGSLPLL
jgi:hypothetical protein